MQLPFTAPREEFVSGARYTLVYSLAPQRQLSLLMLYFCLYPLLNFIFFARTQINGDGGGRAADTQAQGEESFDANLLLSGALSTASCLALAPSRGAPKKAEVRGRCGALGATGGCGGAPTLGTVRCDAV